VNSANHWATLTVKDKGGAVAAGALITTPDGAYQGQTDSEGKALLWLDRTDLRVVYQGQSYASSAVSGDSIITLPELNQVSTVLSDDSGNAKSGVRLYLYAGKLYLGQSAVTDSSGKAVFSNVEASSGYLFDPVPPAETPAASPVIVTIHDAQDQPVMGKEVTATTGTGNNHQGYMIPTGIKGVTDANGQVTLNLPTPSGGAGSGGYDFKLRLALS